MFFLKKNALLRERLEDAETLVRSLEAFVFVAETDGHRSEAVKFTRRELNEYYQKWRNHEFR